MAQSMLNIMQRAPVIPVMVVKKLELAVPLAKTLFEAGLPILEVTLRTPCALEAIKLISIEVPGAIVGAGTVINLTNFEESVAAGAKFIVSPGSSKVLVEEAIDGQIPILPGASTPSEIMALMDLGVTEMKFFPSEVSGGVGMLKALQAPFPMVNFCPTGGVSIDNAGRYLAQKNVVCVGGSWMASSTLVDAENWEEIGRIARNAAALKSLS